MYASRVSSESRFGLDLYIPWAKATSQVGTSDEFGDEWPLWVSPTVDRFKVAKALHSRNEWERHGPGEVRQTLLTPLHQPRHTKSNKFLDEALFIRLNASRFATTQEIIHELHGTREPELTEIRYTSTVRCCETPEPDCSSESNAPAQPLFFNVEKKRRLLVEKLTPRIR